MSAIQVVSMGLGISGLGVACWALAHTRAVLRFCINVPEWRDEEAA